MKKRAPIFLSLILIVQMLCAGPVDPEKAISIARNFYYERANIGSRMALEDIMLIQSQTRTKDEKPVMYIFNMAGKKGFIIVSGDDAVLPVLAYSFESNFSSENPAPALSALLKWYEDQIVFMRDHNIAASEETVNAWDRYSRAELPAKGVAAVSPLLTTTWDQGCYYNAQCPYDASAGSYMCYRCPSGCGATAQAQIMKYHAYPTQGTGSHSYTSSYGTLSANFGTTTYNYGSMPNNVTSANAAVATLMYHIGVSVEMDYSPAGSGSFITDHRASFVSDFNYKSTTQAVSKSSYTNTQWAALLKGDLDNSRPIFYTGFDQGGSSGHAFVVDGYQNNGAYTDNFHINWGWGGYENGYFLLNDLTPSPGGIGGGSYNFNYNNAAIVHIEPNSGGTTPSCNWIPQASAFTTASRGMIYLSVVDNNTCWGIANDGSTGDVIREFSKTTNGGTTWTPGTMSGVSTTNTPSSICAVSSTKAFVSMWSTTAGNGGIFVTTNGGSTWTKQTTANFSGADAFPNMVHFFNTNEGVCMGDPNGGYFEIYTTANGGTTWTRVASANIPANLSGEYGYTNMYDAVGNTIWFATNKGRIYKSTNKGASWTVVQVTGFTDFSKLTFNDANNGLAQQNTWDQNGTVTASVTKKTTDGGATWTTVTTGTGMFYSDIDGIPGMAGKFVSVGRTADGTSVGSSYTTNFGVSWTAIDAGTQYISTRFADNFTGWAGGFNSSQTNGGIYKWNNTITSAEENTETLEASTLVYPNPSNGEFTISLNAMEKKNISIEVYDVSGRLVYSHNGRCNSRNFVHNVSLQDKGTGIFYVIVTAEHQRFSSPVVIH